MPKPQHNEVQNQRLRAVLEGIAKSAQGALDIRIEDVPNECAIREAVKGNIALCERAIRTDPKKRLVDAALLMPFLKLIRDAFDE